MREEPDKENLLIRYLLGDLAEEEQQRVERMFLGDDQQYERLLALEDELFYDYTQGKLSQRERARFEERFLSSEPNRKRVALASAFAHKISESEQAETANSLDFRRQSLKSYFSVRSIRLGFSLASLAVLSLVSIWLAVGTMRLRNEFDRFRAARLIQEDRLQQHASEERARADELNLKLKRELDENAILKKELNEIQPPSGQQRQNLSTVLSIALSPSIIRDRGPGMKKLQIPPGVRLLKLQLNLKGEVDYKFYQAILLTADGAEIWSQNRLTAKPAGSGKAVVFSLPSRLLIEGDYELRLKGYASDGSSSETGDYYYLSIIR
jgi:hypothetical protein